MKRNLIVAVIFFTVVGFSALLFSEQEEKRIREGAFAGPMVGPFGEFADKMPIGSPAPEFTLKDLDGREVSLSSLRGKVAVLLFGART